MDDTLVTLCEERRTLLRRLAPLLGRVGASYDDRSARNRQRATSRRALRARLATNASAIVARVMELHTSHTHPHDSHP